MQFQGFKPQAMERIAGTLGYQGDMGKFKDFLQSDPDAQMKFNDFQNKAIQMMNGGMVRKNYANGGMGFTYGQYNGKKLDDLSGAERRAYESSLNSYQAQQNKYATQLKNGPVYTGPTSRPGGGLFGQSTAGGPINVDEINNAITSGQVGMRPDSQFRGLVGPSQVNFASAIPSAPLKSTTGGSTEEYPMPMYETPYPLERIANPVKSYTNPKDYGFRFPESDPDNPLGNAYPAVMLRQV